MLKNVSHTGIELPYKDRKKYLEYQKKYQKKYYQEHKQYYIDKSSEWKKKNPKKANEHRKKNREKIKKERLESGVCLRCGEPYDPDDILLNGKMYRCSVCRTIQRIHMTKDNR